MQPEIPIINWVLSDPTNLKAGCAQQHFIISNDQAQEDPEGTCELHEEVSQKPMVPNLAKLHSPSQPASTASCGFT